MTSDTALTAGELAVLFQLWEKPRWDGCIIDKEARTSLIKLGLAKRDTTFPDSTLMLNELTADGYKYVHHLKNAALVDALSEIASEVHIYRGGGNVDIQPALSAEGAQALAREVLSAGEGEPPEASPMNLLLEALQKMIVVYEQTGDSAPDRMKVRTDCERLIRELTDDK